MTPAHFDKTRKEFSRHLEGIETSFELTPELIADTIDMYDIAGLMGCMIRNEEVTAILYSMDKKTLEENMFGETANEAVFSIENENFLVIVTLTATANSN